MGEYAECGVDYDKIEPFKMAMIDVAKSTSEFPLARSMLVEIAEHGANFEYLGHLSRKFCSTKEGLGNKNWIAEWMYQFSGMGDSFYRGIGIDNVLMAANDLAAQGAMPFMLQDEVAAGDSEWFTDEKRSRDLGEGFFDICRVLKMALAGGESPAYKYLVKAMPPVKSAPVMSASVTGIIAPKSREVKAENLEEGDAILCAKSSGIHSNGISLVIKRAMELPDQFMTKLPNGHTLGEEALIPTMPYVQLVEALLDAGVNVHAFLPGTGSGISKIAFDKRPFTYRIHSWPEVPLLFQYMRELGVTLDDCLTTFNWGGGYFIYLPPTEVEQALHASLVVGYDVMEIGRVESGERKVIFGPEKDKVLYPPKD